MYYNNGAMVQSKETGELLEVQATEDNGLLIVSDGIYRTVRNPDDLEWVDSAILNPDSNWRRKPR